MNQEKSFSISNHQHSYNEIAKDTANRLSANQYFSISATIMSAVVLPVVIGLIANELQNSMDKNYALGVVLVILIIAQAMFVWLTLKSSSRSFFFEFKALGEHTNELKEMVNSNKVESSALMMFMITINLMRQKFYQCDKKESVKDCFNRVMSPLLNEREDLFNLKKNTLFNIAIYECNKETSSLEVVWRWCDDRLEPKNRSWKIGFGHIGLSYLHETIKIVNDSKKHPDGFIENDDYDRYRSIGCRPIYNLSKNRIHGVLVITTNEVDAFKNTSLIKTQMESISLIASDIFALYDTCICKTIRELESEA